MTYDPTVGVFVSLDPSESLGDNWAPLMMGHAPDPTNSYRYAGNDPVDEKDPTGLAEEPAGGVPFSPYAGGILAPQAPTSQSGPRGSSPTPITPESIYTTDKELAARLLLQQTIVEWVDNGDRLAADLLGTFLDRKGKPLEEIIPFNIDRYGASIKDAFYINERKYFDNLARSLPEGKTIHLDEPFYNFIGRFHSTTEGYNIPQRLIFDADYSVVNEGLFLAFAKYTSSHDGTFMVTCREGGSVSWEYDGRFTITDDYEFPADSIATWGRNVIARYRAANYLQVEQGYAPFRVKTSWQDTISGTAFSVANFPGPVL